MKNEDVKNEFVNKHFTVSRFLTRSIDRAVEWVEGKKEVANHVDEHCAVVSTYKEITDLKELAEGKFILDKEACKEIKIVIDDILDGEKFVIATFVWFDDKNIMDKYIKEWSETDESFSYYIDKNPMLEEDEELLSIGNTDASSYSKGCLKE